MITRWIEFAAWPLAVLGLALATARVIRAMRPRVPGLCPGPAISRWRAFNPTFWIMATGCGYDLSGGVPDGEGCVRCPECGSCQSPSVRRQAPFRWHSGRLAVVVLLTALSCWQVKWIKGGRWAPWAPTPVLLVVNSLSSWRASERVQAELHSRLSSGHMSSWFRHRYYRQLVRELGDDDRRYNAQACAEALQKHLPETVGLLEQALWSDDFQRRQIAASILWGIDCRGTRPPVWSARIARFAYTPGERLFEVSVETLGDDYPGDFGYRADVRVTDACDFLKAHADEAQEQMRRAFVESNDQRSVLAAAVAAEAGPDVLQEAAVRTLIRHLRGNMTQGDAIIAASALLNIGERAIPYLERFLGDHPDEQSDAQTTATAELIVRRLRGDPMRPEEENRLNTISTRGIELTGDQAVAGLRRYRPLWEPHLSQRIRLEQLGVQRP
ncbi:MAG: hypothetical protein AABZ53_11215 [Planctomycetota bacterium]